jgi:transcriptional regulator with XRE-family HTH domain
MPKPQLSKIPTAFLPGGPEFRRRRRERELSQAALAALLGVDGSLISRIERGQRRLHPELALRMLKVLWGQLPESPR